MKGQYCMIIEGGEQVTRALLTFPSFFVRYVSVAKFQANASKGQASRGTGQARGVNVTFSEGRLGIVPSGNRSLSFLTYSKGT